jgi:hypothetical protein
MNKPITDEKAKLTLEQYRRFERMKVIENEMELEQSKKKFNFVFYRGIVMVTLMIGMFASLVGSGFFLSLELGIMGYFFFFSIVILIGEKFFHQEGEK